MRDYFLNLIISYGHFLFRYRNLLFPLILISLLVLFQPYPVLGNSDLDIWMNFLGIIVILSGQFIRSAVIGLAYIKRGGVNKKIHADRLVTEGVFAHCRNPLYLGNQFILTGFLIIHNNLWVYGLGISFFLFSYYAIVKAEETFLLDKFGDDFRNYCNNVDRWLINFNGITATLNSMSFNWKRVIAKDYTTILTWFSTIILIYIREHISLYSLEYSKSFILQMSVLIMIALITTIVVRTLKKSGRLVN